jgi:lipopolysaccharide transport system ATP-binding protein
MSKPVIVIDKLSKSYRLGHKAEEHTTLRDALVSAVKGPFQRLRGLSNGAVTATSETFWALKDVTFEVQKGEVVGIIGRNGAGKSTLLKILSRITEPTSGCVRMRGRVASLLEVGTGFHAELTGRENIFMNGAMLGMRREEIRRKFDEMVAFAEVEKFLDTPVKFYSSGMYVRLAFAVAAHLEPEILIVDEVLAVGDTEFQKKCLGKMQEVSRGEGRTVLFVSHNMAAVRSLCATGIWLERGEVVHGGDAEQVVGSYLSTTLNRGLCGDVALPAGHDQIRPRAVRARLFVNGVCSAHSLMGDALLLEVDFESAVPLRSPRVTFVVRDEAGTRLVNGSNRYQGSTDPVHGMTKGTLVCDLGKVPLMPGRYDICLYFGDRHMLDHYVEGAIAFEVGERDLWGTGLLPGRELSRLYWDTRFLVRPAV